MKSRTFVIVIIEKLLGSDHVKKLKHTAAFNLIGSLRSQTTDSSNTNIEVGNLCGTNAGLADLDLLTSNIHAIELFRSSVLNQDKGLRLAEACKQFDDLLLCQERWDVGNAEFIDGIRNDVGDDLRVISNVLGHCRYHVVARSANLKTTMSSIRAV
ncbi:hypothetical protein HG531_011897 [Fusarium graminearum]|nr:hypothetical protein HG531_011897 [Fusarium graminearum]